MTNILSAESFDAEPVPAGAVSTPTISPQLRFREVRDQLLRLETQKKAGVAIDLKKVQELVSEASALLQQIQTATTGPRQKADPTTGEVKEKKTKAPKKTAANIMPVEDF